MSSELQKLCERKNQAFLEPLAVADLYGRHFDGRDLGLHGKPENEMIVPHADGTTARYKFDAPVNDPKSSFSAHIMRDGKGHTVIFLKGMDLPGRDEGGGNLGFAGDIRSIRQAQRGGISEQMRAAEALYLKELNNSATEKITFVAYSVGTEGLAFLSAKYGATGTAIADMGISNKALLEARKETESAGLPFHYGRLKELINVLDLDADLLPKTFAAGPTRGRIHDLDKGNLIGLFNRATGQLWDAELDIGLAVVTSLNPGNMAQHFTSAVLNIQDAGSNLLQAGKQMTGAAHLAQAYGLNAQSQQPEEVKGVLAKSIEPETPAHQQVAQLSKPRQP